MSIINSSHMSLFRFFHRNTSSKVKIGLNDGAPQVLQGTPVGQNRYKKHYFFIEPTTLPFVDGVLWKLFLTKRSSSLAREGSSHISADILSYVLRCGYGEIDASGRKGSPSAGATYPLSVYVVLFTQIGSIPSGVYRYDDHCHMLETVRMCHFSTEERTSYSSYEWVSKKEIGIFITSSFDMTTAKYGDRGYRYILLEAGHVAQSMLLAGVERGVQGIPVGGVDEERVEELLGVSGEEGVLYALFF